LDQRLTDQLLLRRGEQFAERRVRFLQPAEAVDQRNADRRAGEKALEPLPRQPQRRFPFTLGRQVAHYRAGAQLRARANDALPDPGMDGAAVAALQHDLAALPAVAVVAEWVER